MADIKQGVPSLFPTDEVRVEDEEHRYNVYQEDHSTNSQDRYTLSKAPVKSIEKVTVTPDTDEVEFEKGTDYKLGKNSNDIVWIDGNRPDVGENFFVTYRSDSVLGRYIEQGEKELATVEDELEEIKDGKFVDTATGRQLDRIGRLFGDLGQRRGRNDQEYRIFLKSVTQSFVSRGTKNDIKTALSAATDVPISDISINENFTDNEYEVQILAATPVSGGLIEDVSDIADPSGVSLEITRFRIFPDETTIDDSVSFTEGTSIIDTSLSSDSTGIFRRQFADISVSQDSNSINDNKLFAGVDKVVSDDSFLINPNKSTSSDKLFSDDSAIGRNSSVEDILQLNDNFSIDKNLLETIDLLYLDDTVKTPRGESSENIISTITTIVEPSNKNSHRWEDDNQTSTTGWNFFEWTELVKRDRASSDGITLVDEINIQSPEVTSDDLLTDDSATQIENDIVVDDVSVSGDSVSASIIGTVWNSEDWGTLRWKKGQNPIISWETETWNQFSWV